MTTANRKKTSMDFKRLDEAFVRFTSIAGDQRGGDAFQSAIWSEGGIAWRFVKEMPSKLYGTSLDLILIEFFIEGSHKWFAMPAVYRLGPYAAKQRAMRFAVPIDEKKLALLSGSQTERNALFVEIFSALADAVTKRKFAPTIDFAKPLFLEDLNRIIESLH